MRFGVDTIFCSNSLVIIAIIAIAIIAIAMITIAMITIAIVLIAVVLIAVVILTVVIIAIVIKFSLSWGTEHPQKGRGGRRIADLRFASK